MINLQKSLASTGLMAQLVTALALGLACFLLYVCSYAIYNVFFHPLRKFLGPKTFAATRFPYMFGLVNGTLPFTLKELHDRYGPVVRIGPDRLSFNDGAAFKDIYGPRQGRPNMPKDKKFYAVAPGTVAGLVFADNDADHSRMRRSVAHAFSLAALEGQQDILKEYIDLLIARLSARKDQELDLTAWFNWTTFDIIGDLTFGESFHCLENSEYHPWVHNIFGGVKALSFIHASREYPLLEKIFQFCIPASIHVKRQKHFDFARERTMRRLASKTSRKDFMQYILKNNDTKLGLSDDEIVANAATFVLAGSETTATLLSGVVYYLLKTPPALHKLNIEIRLAFAKEEEIDYNAVSKLKYLDACLQEGLRIYPPVPVGLPRIVPPGGDIIAGHFVPGETRVSVTQWGTYQSDRNFKEPASFKPERWLGDPKFASDKKSSLQPFSLGPRNCVGKHLATVEMRLILTRLLWNFDLELSEESWDWNHQKMFILWQKDKLMVKLTSRKVYGVE